MLGNENPSYNIVDFLNYFEAVFAKANNLAFIWPGAFLLHEKQG
jgi:hypothetical protein